MNPTGADVLVDLGGSMNRVEPQGGGAVDASGAELGTISTTAVTTITVPAASAEILLH